MKKILKSVLLRSLCVLVFGVLLLCFSHEMSTWMIYLCGALFIILGALALVNYYRMKKQQSASLLNAVVAMGCVLFGVVEIVFPDLFSGLLRYLLSGIMFLLAIFQLYSLFALNKGGLKMRWFYYLVPLVAIGVSLFVVFYKGFASNDHQVMLFLGAGFVVYALLELWTIVLVKRSVIVPLEESIPEQIKG